MENTNKHNRIWIAWDGHRRTLELSKAFNAKLYIVDIGGTAFYRYILSSYKTINIIKKEKPDILFVQNPSIFLAALTCIIRPIFNYKLIVDRHTNFKFEFRGSKKIKWIAFRLLSNYTIRKADLTIVTNKYLRLLVSKMGGRGFILPDKLPSVPRDKIKLNSNTKNSALFICTFASDEPYKYVFEAARKIPDLTIYVTGKYHRMLSPVEIASVPNNVRLLGFVSESNYFKYLNSVDFTIVLTNQEFTLNCGAYESISAGKPMVMAGTSTIRNYFTCGTVYVDSHQFNVNKISLGLQEMVSGLDIYEQQISRLTTSLSINWTRSFNKVNQSLKIKSSF